MPRDFNVPSFYRSPSVLAVKNARTSQDPRKRDLKPSLLDFGPVRFKLARHFGFCFGVENAIEIAYRVVSENPEKRIFLLSEMIHNPQVNNDLIARGVRFLMRTDGTRLIDFSELTPDDIVIVPAFGTTIELQNELTALGIDPYLHDATCPFVEKVWKRSAELGRNGFTVIVHGKRSHEETRATFSHSRQTSPTLVVRDQNESRRVIQFMKGEITNDELMKEFKESVSAEFNPTLHLVRIGVVNQTTMLASETQGIANMFREAMLEIYGEEKISEHFADTKDTLCYATNENQTATRLLTEEGADVAIVVGGYNSSNTSHLVELCEMKMPTYFIQDETEIINNNEIRHFDLHSHKIITTNNWLPQLDNCAIDFAITAGASCPDKIVDSVIRRIASFYPAARSFDEIAIANA